MSPKTMTSADLRKFIAAHHIDATILHLNAHTSTVSDAARELGVDTDQIIKSLVFMIEDRPLLVINNGTARVDRKKLATLLGVGRKRVKFASAEQALAITGFVVGSMPPFGHRQSVAHAGGTGHHPAGPDFRRRRRCRRHDAADAG